MTARLSLFFSCDKDKQIFHYFLLCIYTVCSKSVLSLQHGCNVPETYVEINGCTPGNYKLYIFMSLQILVSMMILMNMYMRILEKVLLIFN